MGSKQDIDEALRLFYRVIELDRDSASAYGMAHAVIDRFLAKHGIQRNITLRVQGFLVLPTIVASSMSSTSRGFRFQVSSSLFSKTSSWISSEKPWIFTFL